MAILGGLTLVCHWVAFGDGERHFTKTTSINDTIVDSRPVDERSGRMVFGIAGVILDLVLATLVIKRWRGGSD